MFELNLFARRFRSLWHALVVEPDPFDFWILAKVVSDTFQLCASRIWRIAFACPKLAVTDGEITVCVLALHTLLARDLDLFEKVWPLV